MSNNSKRSSVKRHSTILMFTMLCAGAAHADRFDLPAQNLESALTAVAHQSGVALQFDADSLRNIDAPALIGDYSIDEALTRLLANSGFALRRDQSGYVVERITTAGTVPLPDLTIHAKRVQANYRITESSAATRGPATPIEHIPQSVVPLASKLLDDQQVQTLGNALTNVSNVHAFDQRELTTATDFRVRGFSAGVTVDGMSVPGYFAQQEPLVNIAQIDVVKGPTGSLYGGSQSVGAQSIGGLIAITSKAPEADARRIAGIRYGSHGEREVNVDLNQPLGESLALRLVGQTRDSQSETDRVFADQDFVALSLSWKPLEDAELLLRLRKLDYSYLDFYGLPKQGTVQPGPSIPRRRIFTADGTPDSEVDLDGINLQWRQKLDDVWSWQMTLAENRSEIDSRGLYPWSFFGFGETYPSRLWAEMRSRALNASTTARIGVGDMVHHVTLGTEIDRTHDDGFIVTDLFNFSIPDYLNPTYPAWIEPLAPSTPDQRNRYRTNALYLQDQIDLGRLHFLAGLRRAHVKVDDVNTSPFFNFNNHSSSNKTMSRIGATYELTDQLSLFAGYGEGFKVPITANYATPPKAEESKQTEVGLRLKDLYGVSATLALFDLERRNVTVSQGLFATQDGKQRSRGVDLDLIWELNPELSILAAFSRQDAEVIENENGLNVGNQLFAIPDTTARLAIRYDLLDGAWSGLGMGLGVRHHSRLPGDSANSFYTPATTLWDAQLSYRVRDLKLALSVMNLTDRESWTASNNIGFVYPVPGRTISFSTALEF